MKVTAYSQDKNIHGHVWRCSIDEGPGFYGTGETRAEALINASLEFRRWEREQPPETQIDTYHRLGRESQ